MSYQRIILIIILFFQSVITYLDRACIASSVDIIQHDLFLNSNVMGFVLAAFALGYGIFQIPLGALNDYIGPRKALSWIAACMSFFTLMTATVFNTVQLILVRFLLGASSAGIFPGMSQIFYRWIPVKEIG